jgi:nucleolar pre-ribosomal-associated protein 1
VVAFSHQKHPHVPGESTLQSNPTKTALLAESAQRLLWLYHRSLPSIVAEARFEFGKLLQTFTTEGGSSDQATDTASRLYRVQQLHILKLLNESDQFLWTSKIGMFISFNIELRTTPTYTTLQDRWRIVLSVFYSVHWPQLPYLPFERHFPVFFDTSRPKVFFFQEDPHESDLWLKALPAIRLLSDEEVHDGGPLVDEADAVISFFDDCVQRCLKTPY